MDCQKEAFFTNCKKKITPQVPKIVKFGKRYIQNEI